ncbi:hypothetical protein OIE75_29680 [Streptomyces sp. NBC_01723]|nr:hypothetical protein [Streptomyces sp. NBC_01723]
MTAPPPTPPLVEPGPPGDWWDETPAQAAAADRRYWTDRDED